MMQLSSVQFIRGPKLRVSERHAKIRSVMTTTCRQALVLDSDYKIRRGSNADLVDIYRLIATERMNPLGIDPSRFHVAIGPQGQFLGCCQVEPKPYPDRIKYYELRTMVVDPSTRNKGVGKMLMTKALESVPRDADVWLVTTPQASSFYARHGFDFVSRELGSIPNEIYVEWFAGRIVASLLTKNTVLCMKRTPVPIETPKYF